MPKKNVSDPITDQEIAFARLLLSGTMTDRRAAETVGLKPDSAAYTKAKPRVRAYMLEHRAAVQQQLVEQDTGELRRFNVGRDQVLNRLWDIANMDPERTRNSMSAQFKAISMIVAIEGLIPDRHSAPRAVSAQTQSATPPVNPPFYVSEWRRTQQHGESVDLQPSAAPTQAQEEDTVPEPHSAPGRADDPPPPTPDPSLDLSESIFPGLESLANDVIAASRLYVRFVPDARVPFSIPENPFRRRR
jgi:hypothetical protein